MDYSGSYNGLAFGPNTAYGLNGMTGLDDMPPIRSSDALRTGDHGAFSGLDVLDERTITLDFHLAASTPAAFDALVLALATAFAPQQVSLPFLFNGSTRLINCRPRRRVIPRTPARRGLNGIAYIELVAADPRIYDATLSSPASGLAAAPAGTGFNMAFNVGFGGAASGGYVQVNNLGTFSTRPAATVVGPATNPRLENVTAGKAVKFTITLLSTDTLVIDFDARTVVLNGSSSRRSAVTSDSVWWELAPGASTVRYTADTFDPASTATLSYRSAWL